MIQIYTGTPGSGKSLHLAKEIYTCLRKEKYKKVICNFPINEKFFKKEELERFLFLDNDEITPKKLWDIGIEWVNINYDLSLKKRENCCVLILDEAQLLFNSREWQKNQKKGWTEFFSLHRHAGYRVILCCQMMSAIDKQVRGLIEFEDSHQKLVHMGAIGAFINFILFGGVFRVVTYWTPKNERVDTTFFKYQNKFGELYDTHKLFEKPKFTE